MQYTIETLWHFGPRKFRKAVASPICRSGYTLTSPAIPVPVLFDYVSLRGQVIKHPSAGVVPVVDLVCDGGPGTRKQFADDYVAVYDAFFDEKRDQLVPDCPGVVGRNVFDGHQLPENVMRRGGSFLDLASGKAVLARLRRHALLNSIFKRLDPALQPEKFGIVAFRWLLRSHPVPQHLVDEGRHLQLVLVAVDPLEDIVGKRNADLPHVPPVMRAPVRGCHKGSFTPRNHICIHQPKRPNATYASTVTYMLRTR
ncbi:hypothetical protein RCIX93 [Methanocella arvoryzae MRE50]|uniref:Uncharacterized protein n=1 Tax=Methanocella arvoryzae (strain DSM 22066 / NBRC 105507 / MRE50) TaxID=351160 RepID=Q0W7P7_METAR|nr:hypothetical protein RCIX93 [Methanocella arvoryzae MRE50]